MKIRNAPSRSIQFWAAAVVSTGATIAAAGRWTSDSPIGSTFLYLATAICLWPFLLMVAGLSCLFLPLLLPIILLFAVNWISGSLRLSLSIAFTAYIVVPFLPVAMWRALMFGIYESGADHILPYYARLIAHRHAALGGAVLGIILGIISLWGVSVWHAVDSHPART